MPRGYLINPIDRTVKEVEFDGLDSIYKLLDCTCIDAARLAPYNGDGVYVDDEGLLKEEPEYFFKISGYPGTLAGKGLLHGVDDDGNSTAPKRDISEVAILFVTTWILGDLQHVP